MKKSKPTAIKMSKEEMRWRTEDDMRTLQRANEIQQDKTRMSALKKATMDLNKLVMGGSINKTTKKK
jgi:hypothetical protein